MMTTELRPSREAPRDSARVCAWQDAVLPLESRAEESLSRHQHRHMLAFVRICAHYFRHGAWLEEGILIRAAARLAGIPGVLIHGRRDGAT